MLEVTNLTAGYGDIIAVRDFSFSVAPGRILTIMGANGAGKSSTLMSLVGLVEVKSGTIVIDGQDISATPAEARIAKGIAIAPEGRRIFPDLTTKENLMVGGHKLSRADLQASIKQVHAYFPRLQERADQLAGSLSGGEQQMLAIGRALISRPKYLIIDELSLGLMPKIVDECYAALGKLKSEGIGILLVEQNAERALAVSDDVAVLDAGNPIWAGTTAQARADSGLTERLMGTTSVPA